ARVDAASVAALSARTAKRALRDLTRLVRALGFRGTLVLLEGADVVTRLPPARRAAAYATLRELIDNADAGRGLVATQIAVAGSSSLSSGPRSLASDPPLATRVAVWEEPVRAVPPPHRPLIDLAAPEEITRGALPELRPAADQPALATLLRGAHGLPP